MDPVGSPGQWCWLGGSSLSSIPERLPHCLTHVLPLQDPYFMKNHLGSYECKLCLTLHNNEVRLSQGGIGFRALLCPAS